MQCTKMLGAQCRDPRRPACCYLVQRVQRARCSPPTHHGEVVSGHWERRRDEVRGRSAIILDLLLQLGLRCTGDPVDRGHSGDRRAAPLVFHIATLRMGRPTLRTLVGDGMAASVLPYVEDVLLRRIGCFGQKFACSDVPVSQTAPKLAIR